jgi:hypothetical protein
VRTQVCRLGRCGCRSARFPPSRAVRISSAGRQAPGCVAQLVRAFASHARGHGFESLHIHHHHRPLNCGNAVRGPFSSPDVSDTCLMNGRSRLGSGPTRAWPTGSSDWFWSGRGGHRVFLVGVLPPGRSRVRRRAGGSPVPKRRCDVGRSTQTSPTRARSAMAPVLGLRRYVHHHWAVRRIRVRAGQSQASGPDVAAPVATVPAVREQPGPANTDVALPMASLWYGSPFMDPSGGADLFVAVNSPSRVPLLLDFGDRSALAVSSQGRVLAGPRGRAARRRLFQRRSGAGISALGALDPHRTAEVHPASPGISDQPQGSWASADDGRACSGEPMSSAIVRPVSNTSMVGAGRARWP